MQQPPEHASQLSASATHWAVHASVQQLGIRLHTHDWVASVSQPDVPLSTQHAPAPEQSDQQFALASPSVQQPSPQTLPQSLGQLHAFSVSSQVPSPQATQSAQESKHWLAAFEAHNGSHLLEQQNGSNSQTHALQPNAPQPGVGCASQQLPLQEPHCWASRTQLWLHALVQQLASNSHTHACTVTSSQPALLCVEQHAPSPGQSIGQFAVVSGPLQQPSPHAALNFMV